MSAFASPAIRDKYARLHAAALRTEDPKKLSVLQGLEFRLIDRGEDVPEGEIRAALVAVCGCGIYQGCLVCGKYGYGATA